MPSSVAHHNAKKEEQRRAVMAALRRSTDRPKRKVRKNTGRGIVLRRRPCKTSPSLEALVVDNGIPRIYAWGVCQDIEDETLVIIACKGHYE